MKVYIRKLLLVFHSITRSPGNDYFSVKFELNDGGRAKIRPEIFDIMDGSFLVRWRPFQNYEQVTVNIIDKNGKHVAQSPYVVANIFKEECDCPDDLNQWNSNMNCPATEKQILDDLELFPTIDIESLSDLAFKRHPQWSLVHYSLIDNKVYFTAFSTQTDNWISFYTVVPMAQHTYMNTVKI